MSVPPLPPPPGPPAGPSPAALFFRRVVTGRWDGAALAAGVPALALLALAVLIGIWTGTSVDDPSAGFGTRTQAALALLVQGLGGTLRFTQRGSYSDYGSDYGSDYDGDYRFGDGDGDYGLGDSDGDGSVLSGVTSTMSVTPLTVTLLWVAVLVVCLRVVRRRQTGADAAVRVALLAAVGVLTLALIGQPTLGDVEIGSGPFQAALWAFVITLAVSLTVLAGPGFRPWLDARQGLATAYRVLRTALLALVTAVLLAGTVVFAVASWYYDEVTGWGVALAALMLPNLGSAGLSLGWGGPFEVRVVADEGRTDRRALGLSDLTDAWDGWAAVTAVGVGVVCALVIGVIAVRRSRDRVEQFAVAGAFTVLFVALAALSGLSAGSGGPLSAATGEVGRTTMSSSLPEALAFGLLWSVGGVFTAPYLWRLRGRTPPSGPGGGHVPPSGPGGVPPQPAAPGAGTALDLGIVQPDRLSGKPPRHL